MIFFTAFSNHEHFFNAKSKSSKNLRGLRANNVLQGQCHDIYDTYFELKTRTSTPGPLVNSIKRFCELFGFIEYFRWLNNKFEIRMSA